MVRPVYGAINVIFPPRRRNPQRTVVLGSIGFWLAIWSVMAAIWALRFTVFATVTVLLAVAQFVYLLTFGFWRALFSSD